MVCDPHEIANVLGIDGIRYVLDVSEGLELSVFVMAPSCVPTSSFETSGAALPASALASLRDHPRVLGLAERRLRVDVGLRVLAMTSDHDCGR